MNFARPEICGHLVSRLGGKDMIPRLIWLIFSMRSTQIQAVSVASKSASLPFVILAKLRQAFFQSQSDSRLSSGASSPV